MDTLEPVVNRDELLAMQETVANTFVGEAVVQYVVALIHATRAGNPILRGASPRATLAVISLAKAVAQLRGRDYVIPRDVQEVFQRCIGHRLLLSSQAEAAGVIPEQLLSDIVASVEAPKLV